MKHSNITLNEIFRKFGIVETTIIGRLNLVQVCGDMIEHKILYVQQ